MHDSSLPAANSKPPPLLLPLIGFECFLSQEAQQAVLANLSQGTIGL